MLSDLLNIRIEDFDYPLPDDRIARYPISRRDQSKLLCLIDNQISEKHFFDIPSLLPADTMLVFNDTRVIHARMRFQKDTGAVIEIFCLEPYQMAISEAFECRERCTWVCLVGNNKRWRNGKISMKLDTPGHPFELIATRHETIGNSWIIEFSWSNGMSFAEVIEIAGQIPLPPYLGRDAEESDAIRYQTVYAHHNGSVAAPTAGLHFTPEILSSLDKQGVAMEYITLHVGAGTFKPVTTDTIGEHDMHVEQVQVSVDNLHHFIEHQGPIIAVGTTSVRTLESVYWFGCQLAIDPQLKKMHVNQWDPYGRISDKPISKREAFENVLSWMERMGETHLCGETQLMIAPGYQYRVVDGLITNFHQPKSTLLLLVSALIGDRWQDCYRYALSHQFRFLSYGDSCLFLPS